LNRCAVKISHKKTVRPARSVRNRLRTDHQSVWQPVAAQSLRWL